MRRILGDQEGECALVAGPTRAEIRQTYSGAPLLRDLTSADGVTWLEFRKTLTPDYARAWREIAGCYALLALGLAADVAVGMYGGKLAGLAAAPPAALWIGFWIHALNQFAHEGAHGNLAPDRKRNDQLTDWFLWPLFAQTVRSYQRSHMQHHVHLGDHLDTEVNYHECMNPWFLIKGITGIQMVLMVVRYVLRPKRSPAGGAASVAPREMLMAFARTALLHGSIIALAIVFGYYGAAAAWLLGVAVVYPCLGTARQMLEHRAIDAPCSVDFTQVEHGPVNRLFGDDLFSRCFGAAGLNRHLLHHWDPGISYTRLPDMETFLNRTSLAGTLARSRSGYLKVARALYRTARGKQSSSLPMSPA